MSNNTPENNEPSLDELARLNDESFSRLRAMLQDLKHFLTSAHTDDDGFSPTGSNG